MKHILIDRPPIGRSVLRLAKSDEHVLEQMNFNIIDGVDSDRVKEPIAAFRPMDSQPVAICKKNGEKSLKCPAKEIDVSVSQDSETDTKL
jgi:hypothetical protein